MRGEGGNNGAYNKAGNHLPPLQTSGEEGGATKDEREAKRVASRNKPPNHIGSERWNDRNTNRARNPNPFALSNHLTVPVSREGAAEKPRTATGAMRAAEKAGLATEATMRLKALVSMSGGAIKNERRIW